MLANPRRTLRILVPPIAIATVGILAIVGAIGDGLSLALQGIIIAFLFGQTSVLLAGSEASRRQAIAHIEGFIAYMHGKLERDELDDEERRSAEIALSAAAQTLNQLERSASPVTRWRERRAREKAAR